MLAIESDARCKYTNAEGKRCGMFRAADHSSLCSHHAAKLAEQKANEKFPPEDVTSELLGPLGDFRTAAAVNYTLGKLVMLVGSRRLAPREAATIGYLCQLLLQSIDGVNNEIYKTQVDKRGDPELRLVLEQTAASLKGH